MSRAAPRIWLLIGGRHGDNSQLLALAEELALPFETRTIRTNRLRKIAERRLKVTLLGYDRRSRAHLRPPWPDLVLAIGRRSVPAARWIRRQSRGAARLVHLGNPRIDPRHFDLVLTTPQYPVRSAPNVLSMPLAMSRFRRRPEPTPAELDWLAAIPPPHLLLSVGGSTKYLDISEDALVETATKLMRRADSLGGTLVAVTSPRTQPQLVAALRAVLTEEHRLVTAGEPRFAVLLADADEHFVTADSVSMLSEAILTGKPVGLVPVDLTPEALDLLGAQPPTGEFTGPKRDLRRVWMRLEDEGLVGTVDAPVTRPAVNPVVTAAKAVRRLLA